MGDTAVTLNGTLTIDAKSTSKVDLWSSWEDPIDDLSQPAFVTQSQEMHVAEVTAADPATDSLLIDAVRHSLGDTKYHRVTYWPIATTRFREYFPPSYHQRPDKFNTAVAQRSPHCHRHRHPQLFPPRRA